MVIAQTNYQAQAPEGSVDALILQIVADVAGVSNFTLGVAETVGLSVAINNAFVGQKIQKSAVGLTGSVRMLTKGSPLQGESAEQQSQSDSWIQAAEEHCLSIVRANKTDAIFQSTVQDFVAKVDSYLFSNDQTVLVGDTPGAADIVVSIAIASAAASVGLSEIPQQCYRWIQTVLTQLQTLFTGSDQLKSWAASLKEGQASPLEKPLPPVVESVSNAKEATDNVILNKLQDAAIDYEVYDHALCMTADELIANVPVPEGESHTKNLFMRDKKHGLFLVTVCPDALVNTKDLGKMLNLQGQTNLRLADAALLEECLHAKPGCVGPLAIGVATPKSADDKDKINMVIDKNLFSFTKLHSHPLQNDMSVKLTPDALKSYFQKVGVEPIVLDFPKAGDAEKLGGKAPSSRPAPKPAPKEKGEKAPKEKGEKAPKKEKSQQANKDKKSMQKGETLLAVRWKKTENFAMWYSEVITLSEMISYYDISGCYVLRPWSYKMWELIQNWFNVRIEDIGVENSYFPMFVSQDRLEKEKDHVEGFAPEVAWVTRSGDGELAKPIAVRPTSETIMYPAFADWIRSHRDLPLKINQWSNVVRWEFKYPTPFLRTREFLWQEGHTAHATFEDAEEMVMQALELYRGVYENLLAVPVIKGYKTEKEKFAGGFRTTTVEAYIAGSGRAIQGATSHNLGQNFGKMFDIKYQDEKGELQTVWQTSWGLTTRTIGVMVMVHGDDQGLVLPPNVAPIQVVVVPIVSKHLKMEDAAPYCVSIMEDMKKAGIRCKFDDRDIYNPGWKYNHWEQKGVPIRVEVGPRDIENKCVRVVLRHDGSKEDISIDGLGATLAEKLTAIQNAMFEKARAARDSHIVQITEWKDFVPNLEKHNLVLTPWCGGEHKDWEEWVKEKSREESLKARGEEGEDEKSSTSVAAKTLCIPFDQPELPAGTKCIASGMDATCWVLWGRSY